MEIKKHFNKFTYVLFFFIGCIFAANQLMIHYVRRSLGATEMQLGMMIGSIYIGSMLMALVLGELSEKAGKRIGAIIAAGCFGIGALLIVVSGQVEISVISYFIYGCGAGGLEAMLFSLIGDYNGKNTSKHMNLTQALFSIGAFISPVLINIFIMYIGYKAVYTFIWIIMTVLTVVFILDKSIDSFAIKSNEKVRGLTIFKLARNPAMLIFMLVLLVAIGCETALTYWLINYFDLIGASGIGAFGLSMYWFFSIPGRIIGARVRNQGKYLILCFLLCSIGIAFLLLLPNPVLKLIGVSIIGIALAPVYPSISTIGGSLSPKNSGAAFSLMVFSCGLGGAAAQPIIGYVSRFASISTLYVAIAVIMIILALMVVLGIKASGSKTRLEVGNSNAS